MFLKIEETIIKLITEAFRKASDRDLLPAVYRNLLPAFFDTGIVEERHATCDDCAMCRRCESGDSGELGAKWYFASETKCCTYYPAI